MYLGMFNGLARLAATEATFIDAQGAARPLSQLRSYTINFLEGYYDLVAVAPRTISQLRSYLADEFVRDASEEEAAQVSFNTPYGSRSLDQLVKMISPLSKFKQGWVLVSTTFDAPKTVPGTGPVYGPALPPPTTNVVYGPELPPGYGANPVAAPTPPRPSTFIDASGRQRPDSDLPSYARLYLEESYNLRPVGSETLAQLKERIMYVFLRHQGVTSSGATFDSAIGPVTMDQVVRAVSPLSTPKAVYGPTVREIAAKGPVAALTTPGPGKRASWLNLDQIAKLLEASMKGYSSVQKQQAAAQLMAAQKQGRPLQIDSQTDQALKKTDNTWMYAAAGTVILGGLLFALMRD